MIYLDHSLAKRIRDSYERIILFLDTRDKVVLNTEMLEE